ncbi:hypothetical protein SAMN05444358_11410 [Ruegeria halocynthiae]|uniref:Uncharacterized protein n=1 Tax=Ruegeria halocynthiae TaxID=985054 RepID=A0A1H3FAM3_9RHOB|nr:hypothetical protein [Ruegeria halocynthiae]SDX87990.1 hypothetical protein SAMN05444358_11410 [Ruegeria halocynthiae]
MFGLRNVSARHIIVTVAILNFIMVVVGYIGHDNPTKHYREGTIGTHISILLLALIALVNFQIFLRQKHVIWLLISLGFAFLAFDEGFEIHEGLDKAFHRYFGISQTSLTDRIDDILIGIYGLIGAGILYRFRAEILRYKVLLQYLLPGFAFLAASVVFDAVTNDNALFLWAGIPETYVLDVKLPLRALEEVSKLMAEAIFLAGFVQVFRQVKADGDHTAGKPLDESASRPVK